METKIVICSRKRVPGRISKYGLVQSIQKSLKKVHPEGHNSTNNFDHFFNGP